MLVLAGLAYAQPLPLAVARVAPTAELRRGDEILELRSRVPLSPDDRVVTGPQGRVSLQLYGGGALRLGGDSTLRLHSIEPPGPGNSGVAKLILERGALRLDARGRSGQPPQDYRLNAGRLRLRVFGGEAWTEVTSRGESVCLLSGAVEIVADTGGERLDQPGACLVFGQGGRLPVHGDGGEALARKLLRTAFADDLNARALAEQTPEPVAEVLPPADPAVASPEAAPVPVPATPGPRWTLVLASFPDPAAAENAVRSWLNQGETPQVRRSDTPSGVRFRVTVGDYADLAQARAGLTELRSRQLNAAEAWVMPVKD
ncbi:SPOR domain-containing protein [Solimonas sp. SE-A11]|uniref:SPOR domain-containing protein n=1 Tax=Solimonas sp. SE-A11 TaxID=3054954 RepID=UPI00259D0070|nr:SPOR domain-containing protein [Solimonas sp. SE-A11]MDM4770426.1 SPOR domain-containing protein [Solimonas sp. SE-A11]